MSKLLKVELYRFSRNAIAWICMVVIMCVVLFSSSDETDMLMGDNSTVGIVTSTMKLANLLIVLIVSVAVSSYIGREFKQKTICYEVINGYRVWHSSLIKTLSCGLLNAIIMSCGIFLFIKIMEGDSHVYSCGRLLLIFVIICHYCTCITLYIMLFRDGAMGGCIAFVRFTLLSVFGLFIAEIVLPQHICELYMALSPLSQWNVVINVEYYVPMRYIVGILGSFALEYLILMIMIHFFAKKTDF